MKNKKEFKYRNEPSSLCKHLLETTPKPHYVAAKSKIAEIILINRFGKKNIPVGCFWRLADTSKEVYGAQKYLWPVIGRLLKTYDGDIVLMMVQHKRIKFLSAKQIPQYLYWCKEIQDKSQKMLRDSEKINYNKVDGLVEDNPQSEIKHEKKENLKDWLE